MQQAITHFTLHCYRIDA